jgi:hypothetical protein
MRYAVKNNFGFGGTNGTLVFGKINPSKVLAAPGLG